MTLRMQGLLLRYLETGEIQTVGADRVAMSTNTRVIAATNRVLRDLIAQGVQTRGRPSTSGPKSRKGHLPASARRPLRRFLSAFVATKVSRIADFSSGSRGTRENRFAGCTSRQRL